MSHSFITSYVQWELSHYFITGYVQWDDVYWMLKIVAHNLPFPARVVSQEMLEKEEIEKQKLIDDNVNPFTFEYVAKNQMYGAEAYLSPYDYIWYNEHR